MTNNLNEQDEQKVVEQIQKWLGYKGIAYFKDVKETHGTVNATWLEPFEADMIPQWIPRCIDNQEGDSIRKFLKTLKECKGWEDEDFHLYWIPMLEKSIQENKDED